MHKSAVACIAFFQGHIAYMHSFAYSWALPGLTRANTDPFEPSLNPYWVQSAFLLAFMGSVGFQRTLYCSQDEDEDAS